MNLSLLRSVNIIWRAFKSSARHGGNHRRSFRLESLESRELLAATQGGLQIGAGLDGLNYWDTTLMFKDVMKETDPTWFEIYDSGPLIQPSSPLPLPAMDSNGYPIGLGNLPSDGLGVATRVFENNGDIYPTGTYTLTFDGSGTVEIIASEQPPQVFSQSGGLGSPSNVYINSTWGLGIQISIVSSNPSDYVRNIRLVMPGFQNSYVSEPFNPAFLSELEPFQFMRVGGLMQLNTTTQNVGETWAEETPVTYRTQTNSGGVSVQYLVELANILQENLWVNMPVGADSSFVTNFSQYVAANLDSNLKVYVEYGNEVWNTGYFDEWNYVNQYATANNLNFWQADAVLATNMWNVWLQSFAGQTNRVLRVVANQFSVPPNYNAEIQELVKLASPSDPDHGFDVISGAPYLSANESTFNATTTVQQIEQATLAALPNLQLQLQSFMNMVGSWETTLNQTIPAIMYETGIGLTALSSSVPWYNALIAAETDPGMYSVFLTYLDAMQAAGVAGFNMSDLVDPASIYGEWGTMDYTGEPPSLTPKYDALLDFMASQGLSLSLDDSATTLTAGEANSFTVTADNADGDVDTGYTGTVQFSSSDSNALLPASYTFTAADAGEHTFSVEFDTAGTQSISVTDSTNELYSLDWGIAVQPAAAASLAVVGYPSPATAGIGQLMVIYALDKYNNIATGYTGTVEVSSSDPHASLGYNGILTFTTGGLGCVNFPLVLYTAGVQSITAADTSSSSITGTESGVTVQPAAVNSFTLAGFPNPTIAGGGHNFTVTAIDPYGNIVASYLGTVTFTSSDPSAMLPANYTFTSSNAGTAIFSAALLTPGSQYLRATDTSTSNITGEEANIKVQPVVATSFTVTGFPTTATAGSANNITVTAYNANGKVASGYTGTVTFTSSDPQASLPANYTFTSSNAGTATFSAALLTAGTQSITVTDAANSSCNGTEASITVQAAPAKSLAVTGFSSPAVAGTASNIVVTALDAYGNVATGYTGTVNFTSSDPQASLPANYTFTSSNAGTATFSATFETAGTQSITAIDTDTSSITGRQSGIAVGPGSAFVMTNTGLPSSPDAETALPFTLAVFDRYGNVVTNFLGTMTFSSSDPSAELPAPYTFTAADAGVHTFSVTFETVGTQTLTAASGSLTNVESGIAVQTAPTSTLSVTSFPSTTAAGTASSFTVTARDANGNISTGYRGTVEFTSSDPDAELPASYTFTAADAGTHTFSATLLTAGTQSITAADTATSSINGTETSITVQAASANSFAVSGFSSPVGAGTTSSFVVTALDAYGNVATGYTGTVNFTSSDPQASLPANFTFTSSNAGMANFSATLLTAGTQSITATDTANSSINGTETSITVHASPNSFSVTGFSSPVTAGTAFTFVVTALNANGNVFTGYTGTVTFTSSDPNATLPANYTFTAADGGTHIFSATLMTAGTQSITATDTAISSITGTESSTTVQAASVKSFAVSGFLSPVTAGTASNFVVTALDAYGNVVTGYTGTVKFTSSDPNASLPANYIFTSSNAGKATFSATLKTAGAQSITATDTATSSINGAETSITVQAAAANSFAVSEFSSPITAGTASKLVVTALDAYGNVATGYTGTVEFTSSDPQASLPANYTFTSSNAGQATVFAALGTAGTQSITATDTATSSITGKQSGITVEPGAASAMGMTALPNPLQAGTAYTFTLTVFDRYDNVVTNFVGTMSFNSTDGSANLPAPYTYTSADAGVHTFSVTFETVGTQTLQAACGSMTRTKSGITVQAASASKLVVTGFPSTTTAGTANNFTVTAYNANGSIDTGYLGTVEFTSSDPNAKLPASYTFTAANAGTATFSATLDTAGTQSITTTDTETSSINGTETSITVQAAAAKSFAVTGFSSPVTAGAASNFVVTALDAYGNVATGYAGTVRFTSSDPNAKLPASYTFTAANAGKATFSATLDTAGTQSITATDTTTSSIHGAETSIAVQAASAKSFTVTGFSSPVTAGTASNFVVTALDAFGNVATGYAGTVTFTSSDPKASLPANYTFTSSNAGKATFSATLKTAGAQSLKATATATSSINGTESSITVQAASAKSFAVTGFSSSITAGTASNFVVTALDAYGNVATGYTGTVTFTSSDPQASLPAKYTFTSTNAGKATFSATLKTAGTQSITATDTKTSSIIGKQSGITVTPAAAVVMTITGLPSSLQTGTAYTFTLTVYDSYGNVATNFLGTMNFSGSDGSAKLPAAYTFTAANAGVHTFSVTFETVGTQTLKVYCGTLSKVKSGINVV
jgi:hypothetical protein